MFLDEWIGYGIPESAVQEATQWLVKLDSGSLSEQQQGQFNQWLDSDPTHRWAFEELAEVWAKMATLNDVQHQIELPEVVAFPVIHSPADEPQDERVATDPYAALISIAIIVAGFVALIVF
ncbi:DUF4880 domain-containing protein [Alteromonadaceae bacterium BrNp21-10]|nr:DUF4880 domain-containing protein [Alteromonadaceae bacterium BrNp21-10]